MPTSAIVPGSGTAAALTDTASKNRNPESSRKLNTSGVLEPVAVRTKLKFWNELCAAGLFKSKSDTPPNEAAKWLLSSPFSALGATQQVQYRR
jgi:hypothetical protein